jgi:hypothetical protein
MVSQVTQQLFATTYKDDYADSDNYHRILFNSGRALQARELTQMQTIIQNEIARFGRNIFKEGAAVNPGGPTLNTNYEFVKLNTSVNTLPGTPSSLVGTIFVGASSNLRGEVLQVVEAEGSDPATLYVKYVGDNSGGGATALRFTPGENLSNGSVTLTVQTTNTTLNPAIGRGTQFSCSKGDFFAFGHFVFVPQQSLIVSKYSSLYTGTVGFLVSEDVVTAQDNVALYDNQNVVPNASAPGADRYRIRLTLIDKDNVDSDQFFVYYCDVVESSIVDQATGSSSYNEINDVLALRTKEESGNYVAKQFTLKYDADSDNDYLIADISDGTAYVNGYRAAVNKRTKIRVAKPTTTATQNNEVVAANYGNYIIVSSLVGVPNVNEFERWNLRSATSYGGSTIGTARIRHVEEDGAVYKLSLFDIQMNAGSSFLSVRSIGVDAANYANLVLENGSAALKDASNNDLLFPLPTFRPEALSDISFEVQKRFTITTDGAGNASLGSGLLGASQTWSSLNDWVVAIDSNGSNISSIISISGAGTTTATITGTGSNNTTLEILAYVNNSAATIRPKTLTETTVTGTIDSDGNGLRFLNLGKADIYDVSRIRAIDSDGTDLTATFRFDNGQRDNYYDLGKLAVRSGRSVPAGNVFARFRYFAHGTGDFFAVNSYSIDYADIPSHTLADGTVVQLRDVLDFRSRINDAGTGYTGATAKVNPLPKNADLVTTDISYYLGRNDSLVINEDGVLSFIQGTSDFVPQFPSIPSNSLELYRISLNPNTIDPTDTSTQLIDNRRYTMKDIARLDKRLSTLEEITALNLLELDTSTLQVLDSSGLPRTKAGFLADNFADHTLSDITDTGYRASIDPRLKLLRPSVVQNNLRLIYDSDLSTDVVKRGDNLYIRYNEVLTIEQNDVSTTENINPFAVVTNLGFVDLSPSSDEWKETTYTAARVIDGGTRLDTNQARLFNEWQWNWQGIAQSQQNLTGTTLASTGFNTVNTRGNTTTTIRGTISDFVASDETIREVVGDRIVSATLIPFIRSRKVYFKAYGLIPNQRYYAFFDGVDVNDWVREETFTRFSDDPTDYGNRYQNATSHPDGSTSLISDANGIIEGSFFVPSTLQKRFRAGQRELLLININSTNRNNSTSLATGRYIAQGVLETRQETIRSTRQVVIGSNRVETRRIVEEFQAEGWDPLAQSFMVTEAQGIFLTKTRVYFASKPDVGAGDVPAPVVLQIRPVVNGFPVNDPVPGATKILTPSEVTVVGTQTQAGVIAAGTDFVFDEPVYLQGNTEYAIVLLSDTTKYNVYVAEAGGYVLGSTERRITRQPSLGSLFLSQNGRTWTPDQTKDLTFKLYKAEFQASSAEVILENADLPLFNLPANPLEVDSGERWVTVSHPYHGFDSGDTVTIYGLDSATSYGGILGTSILGTRTVNHPDAFGYRIYADSAATSTITTGNSLVEATQNIMFDIVNPTIQRLTPSTSTSVTAKAKFTSGKSLAGNETRFIKDTSYQTLTMEENNVFLSPKMIGNTSAESVDIGAKSATISLTLTSTNSDVTPIIDLQRASLNMINNLIDKQDSDRSASGFNTPLVFVNETQADGGSHVAIHKTVPVTLVETAVGLRILLAANRPADADFLVYWRTADEGTNIRNVNWNLVQSENVVPSDENPSVFREYRYLVGGPGGSLTPFTTYQVKIVFRSINSSKVPAIKDLRVIAMAT